ncbi:hypothetical protein E7V67_011450 [[Empedobacter] haloabium]|uniref:Uncharacterized protein n=1 Tax=[Empedobacter] haloabium TaxID=592317 RepID=A0ABZ1USH2_9BURK
MNQRTTPAAAAERIVTEAHVWRAIDKDAIANKQNPNRELAAAARRAEYRARQNLRKAIDEAGA